ncbi:VOC family protein [Kitasatospora sp. NPDC002551]|uniref:VOC family protein n=1 Tax=Kitasatospora sp. NPDC002551 TaxID=3154539 RepID=UPI0033267A7D
MSPSTVMITVGCSRPQEPARWWATAPGGEITQDDGDFVIVTARQSPAPGFRRAAEQRQGRNRAHLDFATAPGITLAQQVQRLAGPGASAAREHSVPGPTRAVLQDPAGNEFRVHRTATAPAPEAVAHHRRHRRAPCRGPGEGAGKPACPRPWHRHSPAGGTSRHPHQAEETRAVATPADARARHHAPGGSCSS